MRIERDTRGDYVLDSGELAPKLGLSADELRRHMKAVRVTSLVEAGQDEDAGLCRLTERRSSLAGNRRRGWLYYPRRDRRAELNSSRSSTDITLDRPHSLKTSLLSIVLFANWTTVPTTKPRALHSGLRALNRKSPVRAA
jgi:hypothetical protein